MKFKKGDRVKFIDEVGEGRVIAVKGNQVFVRDEHGFDFEMSANELVLIRPDIENLHLTKVAGIDSKLEAEALAHSDAERIKLNPYRKKNATKNVYLEIDLHIHELVDDSTALSNFEIVNIQLSTFKRMLEMAQRDHYQRVIFIHGVGSGILRFEIRKLLGNLSNCDFGDADYAEYGQGATEVNLWYN